MEISKVALVTLVEKKEIFSCVLEWVMVSMDEYIVYESVGIK